MTGEGTMREKPGDYAEESDMVMCPPAPTDVTRDALRNLMESLDTPHGYRTELIDGEIIVTPPAQADHEGDIGSVNEQVILKSATRLRAVGGLGVITPGNDCVPDLTVGPRELFRGSATWVDPTGVELVVEVTSPSSELRDRQTKRRDYAAANIPLYLLVDRNRKSVTLFSEPDGTDYKVTRTASFGENLPLPQPFAFELDTSDLY